MRRGASFPIGCCAKGCVNLGKQIVEFVRHGLSQDFAI
jgi:hypothetical protein